MANNLGVTTGSDATIRTTDNAGIHLPHHAVSDGTTSAAVKAASTAPVASDPALVVAISPNGVNPNGRATSANSAPVTLPSDAAASGANSFTPAAASHTAGDVNGAAAEFTLVGLTGSRVMITSATLEIDSATAEATTWTLHLYNITPPSALADDAVFNLPAGDRGAYLGKIDLGTAVDQGDTQWVETHGINKQIKLSGTSVFGYLVNNTTLTPAAVAHIVTLHTVQL